MEQCFFDPRIVKFLVDLRVYAARNAKYTRGFLGLPLAFLLSTHTSHNFRLV